MITVMNDDNIAVTATCDVDCGNYYASHLKHGVENGYLKESDLDEGKKYKIKIISSIG